MFRNFFKRAIFTVIVMGLLLASTKSAQADEIAAVVTDGSWKYTDTEIPGWTVLGFDDSTWQNVASPSRGLCGSPLDYNHPEVQELGGFNIWKPDPATYQTVYFRKTFVTPSDLSNLFLATLIGGIDDDGDIYINGVLVLSNHDGHASQFADTDVTQYLNSPGDENVVNLVSVMATDTAGGCQYFALAIKIEDTPQSPDNIVKNGSFELPAITNTGYKTFNSGQTFEYWTVDSGSVDIVTDSYWQVTDGRQSVDLTGINNAGTIFQDLDIVAEKQYTLRFALAGNSECPPQTKNTEVWWGSALIDSVSFNTAGKSNADMGWTYHTYTASAPENATQLRLKFKSLNSGNCGPVIDDVSVKLIEQPDKFVYVALGDSYQSGEGAGNSISDTQKYNTEAYEPGTYTYDGGNSCHRSFVNYPKLNRNNEIFGSKSSVNLIDMTCSGASIEPGDIPERTIVGETGSATYDQQSQIALALQKLNNQQLTPDKVDLVTVGMGGNDAKFIDIIIACFTPNIIRELLNNYPNPPAEIDWLVNQFASCELVDKAFFHTQEAIDTLPEKESWAQSQLLKTFPQARVLQLNYPNILPEKGLSPAYCGGIRKEDLDYARRKDADINKAINESVATGPSGNTHQLVDVEKAFGKNALCPLTQSTALANGISQENFTLEIQRLLNLDGHGEVKSRQLVDQLVNDYKSWKLCVSIFNLIGCSAFQYNQLKTDMVDLVKYIKDDQYSKILGNLARKPDSEDPIYRFDRSNGLFHPNAKGQEVLACHVAAAYNQGNTDNCLQNPEPYIDTINNFPIANAPVQGSPGMNVYVRIGGFEYNSPVRIIISSQQTDLGTVTSDANGFIDTTIILPELGGGVHTLWFLGASPGGTDMRKRVRIEFPGRPDYDESFTDYLCGFTPNIDENSSLEKVDVNYLGEKFDTLIPDEDGCIFIELPIFDFLNQAEPITVTVYSQLTGKTFTTDVDQIPSVAGIWATSLKEGVLSLTGSDLKVMGLVHSDADMIISGNRNTLTGGIEYAKDIKVTGNNHSFSFDRKVSPGGLPTTWNIADFRPNGNQALKAGENYHAIPESSCKEETWNIQASDIPNGIVYVPCSVKIQGSNSTVSSLLIAEGNVEINGSDVVINPYKQGMPAIISGTNSSDAVRLSGANIQILGTIQALNSGVQITGAKGVYRCGIIAKTISLSGSGISILVDDQCRNNNVQS